MLSLAFTRYINNFRGFSREVWILTLITFINRAGTMVLPFLSKYLNEGLHIDLNDVGTIMVCFGLGSIAGSWLGGKLTDKIGFYKVMVFSLFTSGLMFFVIQHITTFTGLCIAMFSIMVIADMFRPAMFVSIATYAKPENRTRAMTLVRLAVNLGFAAGPAMGGLIIIAIGYKGLFWIDGASCIISILIFRLLVKEKKKTSVPETFTEQNTKPRTIYNDTPFQLLLLSSFLTTLIFFQLFTTLPLYHHKWYGWNEFHTGLLMSFNGLMVFFFEMPIVGYMERHNISKIKIIFWGVICMILAFLCLLINVWAGILIINVLFLTFGEILCFPFTNSFAFGRAARGREGQYMALYTMTFSLAHTLSAKIGMGISDSSGFDTNWIFMSSVGIVSAITILGVQHLLKKEALE